MLDRQGSLTISYAPFDHANTDAKIVLVGITPGRQQAVNALLELQRQLLSGADLATAAARAKGVASFSGPMRKNLLDQLDYFRIHHLLGISSCADLFGVHGRG